MSTGYNYCRVIFLSYCKLEYNKVLSMVIVLLEYIDLLFINTSSHANTIYCDDIMLLTKNHAAIISITNDTIK